MELELIKYLRHSIVQLNPFEKSLIQYACMEMINKTERPITFWGRINGVKRDYYILVMNTDSSDQNSSIYFYSNDALNFLELPKAEINYEDEEKAQFCGNNFIPLMGIELNEANLTDHKKELEKVGKLVQLINQDTLLVPRKIAEQFDSKFYTNTKPILKVEDVICLEDWIHKREPKIVSNVLKNEEDPTLKIWDSIADDLPTNSWVLRYDCKNRSVSLQSLLWPGYLAYCMPDLGSYYGCYFGNGECYNDLAFLNE